MAVPKHERSEAKNAFLDYTEKLQQKTNDIVMNEKYVPKKYRYIWIQEVFQLSMHIFENARRANIIYPRNQEEYKLRLRYLALATADSEALLSQIAFARKNFSIPNGLLEEWEKMCASAKRLLRKKYNDDKERFAKVCT